MGRAILLDLCPDSLHKVKVWACVLSLCSGPAHVLLYVPSYSIIIFPISNKRETLGTHLILSSCFPFGRET